jgi:hypothetical protein
MKKLLDVRNIKIFKVNHNISKLTDASIDGD